MEDCRWRAVHCIWRQNRDFWAGRRATGAVRSIEYAGLLRLQYAVQLNRKPNGRPSHASIFLRSEYDVPGSPAFVLINHPDRIPLSHTDGEAVNVAPLDAQGQLAAIPSKELRWSSLTTQGTAEAWGADAGPARMDQVVRQRAFRGAAAHHCAARPADRQPPPDGGRAVNIRYGQLTYTSFDSFDSSHRAGAGGWQIKQCSGELSADERDWLVSELHRFSARGTSPDYPARNGSTRPRGGWRTDAGSTGRFAAAATGTPPRPAPTAPGGPATYSPTSCWTGPPTLLLRCGRSSAGVRRRGCGPTGPPPSAAPSWRPTLPARARSSPRTASLRSRWTPAPGGWAPCWVYWTRWPPRSRAARR